MKILHIIDDLSMGGGQNLLIGLAGIQQKQGNDVCVLTLKDSTDHLVQDKIEAEGVKVAVLSDKIGLYNPLMIFTLISWLRKYDIVHVHLFPALYWAGIAGLISGCRTPLLYTEHSTNNKRRSHFLLRHTDRFIYQHCYDKIIACSDKALDTFLQVFPDVRHACAINNGVDTQKNRNAKPYTKHDLLGVDEQDFIVTMVSRFLRSKRQDILVDAISKLPSRFHACLVGSEPSDKYLIRVKEQAEKLGVADRIHFMYLRPDVPQILKTSDIVVMSSEYEGLSLSSIEGMAAGKPFVATNADGLREVVGGAGELFELYDSNQLAEIISRLASDTKYYHEIAKRCQKRASEYDINIMVQKYMAIYHEIITEK